MGKSKRIFQEEQEWDAWEHLQQDESYKAKTKKVKKMKLDKPLFDRKRK